MIALFPSPEPYTPVLYALVVGLCGAGLIIFLSFLMVLTCLGDVLYTCCLLFLLPSTALALVMPMLWQGVATPFLQVLFLFPLIAFPLSVSLRDIPASWTATAKELGANRYQQIRLLWWPLLKRPAAISLCVAFLCGVLR